MAIRLVAVDVDGTLVTADQRVLPRVQAAAQRALEGQLIRDFNRGHEKHLLKIKKNLIAVQQQGE